MNNIDIQWIILAQRTTAKIYQSTPAGTRLKLRKGIAHPSGRLKDQDFLSDSAGRVFRSPGVKARSGTDSENTPHDHDAEVFALELATLLDQARSANSYDQLVLIAEPRFLGKLKLALSKSVTDTVVRIIAKDLYHISEAELERRLVEFLAA